jgi:hypothetical protein
VNYYRTKKQVKRFLQTALGKNYTEDKSVPISRMKPKIRLNYYRAQRQYIQFLKSKFYFEYGEVGHNVEALRGAICETNSDKTRTE